MENEINEILKNNNISEGDVKFISDEEINQMSDDINTRIALRKLREKLNSPPQQHYQQPQQQYQKPMMIPNQPQIYGQPPQGYHQTPQIHELYQQQQQDPRVNRTGNIQQQLIPKQSGGNNSNRMIANILSTFFFTISQVICCPIVVVVLVVAVGLCLFSEFFNNIATMMNEDHVWAGLVGLGCFVISFIILVLTCVCFLCTILHGTISVLSGCSNMIFVIVRLYSLCCFIFSYVFCVILMNFGICCGMLVGMLVVSTVNYRILFPFFVISASCFFILSMCSLLFCISCMIWPCLSCGVTIALQLEPKKKKGNDKV